MAALTTSLAKEGGRKGLGEGEREDGENMAGPRSLIARPPCSE